MNDESVLERRLLLLARIGDLAAKDKLGLHLPLLGDLPLGVHLLVGDGDVVLQVCAEAFSFESGPHDELVHGGGVLGPCRKELAIDGEGFLLALDDGGVFEEEDLRCGVLVS